MKVVEYEPYKPMTIDETTENLEWRIGTDEMIAVELKSNQKMIGNVYMGKRDFEALEENYFENILGRTASLENQNQLIRNNAQKTNTLKWGDTIEIPLHLSEKIHGQELVCLIRGRKRKHPPS